MKNRIVKSGVTGFRVFLILSFIALMLLFGAGIVAILIALLENRMELNGFLFMSGFCLAVVGLSLWGVILQIKKIKKDKRTEFVEYTEELNICFETQMSYKDYICLTLGLSFKKPRFIIILIWVVFSCLSLFLLNDDPVNEAMKNPVWIFVLAGIVYIPISIRNNRITNEYLTNKTFQEQLSYTLDNRGIHLKSETIDTTVLWTQYYKIKETKNFFLLYPGKSVATLLPKKAFKAEEIAAFRRFAKSLDMEVEVNE